MFFRNNYSLSPARQAHISGNIPCITTHNLNDRTTVVASACVADFVNCFLNGIKRRVKPDGVIGTANVVVYCARNSNSWQAGKA